MAASGVITLKEGIPVIMGSNVGTSITSTMVSLTTLKDLEEYRLGFSAAIIHDLFNWCIILVLLPLEIGTGALEKLTDAVVNSFDINNDSLILQDSFIFGSLFSSITNALVELKSEKEISKRTLANFNITQLDFNSKEELFESLDSLELNSAEVDGLDWESSEESNEGFLESIEDLLDSNEVYSNISERFTVMKENCGIDPCSFLFAGTELSDQAVGGILLAMALSMFLISYFIMSRATRELIGEVVKNTSATLLSKDLPYVPWLTQYLFLLGGTVITIIVQSSSIVTSALVPLVSNRVITLEKAFPIAVGSNLGTTATSLIAAFSLQLDHSSFKMALCHTFINLIGIIIFFLIPQMRWPLFIAKKGGDKAVKYKWFSIFYLISSFFLLPLGFYALSLIHHDLVYAVSGIIYFVSIIVVTINYLQDNKPEVLPYVLRNWQFLPKPLRTFSTVDYVVQTYMEVYCCCFVRRTV